MPDLSSNHLIPICLHVYTFRVPTSVGVCVALLDVLLSTPASAPRCRPGYPASGWVVRLNANRYYKGENDVNKTGSRDKGPGSSRNKKKSWRTRLEQAQGERAKKEGSGKGCGGPPIDTLLREGQAIDRVDLFVLLEECSDQGVIRKRIARQRIEDDDILRLTHCQVSCHGIPWVPWKIR